MESHHWQRAQRGWQEGHPGLTLLSSRSLFLAAAASSCSAESCFSFSSSCRFRTATGSPFCVACQHGMHISGDQHLQSHPLHPTHTGDILPSAPGENSAPFSQTPSGPACLKMGCFPSPAPPEAQQSPTVCQVSWMIPAFSVRISMSCWASPSLNTMLLTVDTRVL